MTITDEQLIEWKAAAERAQLLVTANALRTSALVAEIERLREALRFYANPEIYKPHPNGPAFDKRDLSFAARAALPEKPS